MRQIATDNSVSGRLELTRHALGLSVREYAKMLGITFQAYYGYLDGLWHSTPETVLRLIESTRHSITHDWIYVGDIHTLPDVLQRRIRAVKSTMKAPCPNFVLDTDQERAASGTRKQRKRVNRRGKEDGLVGARS